MKNVLRVTGAFVTLGCLGFVFGGCSPVVSVRPLYTEEEAAKPYLDQRIEGAWLMPVEDDPRRPKPPCNVAIAKVADKNAPYTVELRCTDEDGQHYSKYGFHLIPSNNLVFFDAQFRESEEKGKHISADDVEGVGLVPGHLLGQIWIQDNFLRFSVLGSDWVEKNWAADSLVVSRLGLFRQTDMLTNSTRDLRDALARNAGSLEAFDVPLYLCRPGTDCIPRAVADQLARAPEDTTVLEESVTFYSSRGDFTGAIALQKRKITTVKDAGNDQFILGRLLLLNGDFSGAREALVRAEQKSESETPKQLTVLSYFLQGDYAGAIRAEGTMTEPSDHASADPIILSYFAQYRLGRAKQADAFLRQKADSFVGPGSEALFLRDILGQVTDSLSSTSDQHRTTFYYALNRLKNRDIEGGRGHLQDLVTESPKDDLLGLAARVELQRLPAAPVDSAK